MADSSLTSKIALVAGRLIPSWLIERSQTILDLCTSYTSGTLSTLLTSFSSGPLSTLLTAWGVKNAANGLVQLNASRQLPAVSGALLTDIATLPPRHINGFVPSFTAFAADTAAFAMSAGTAETNGSDIEYPGGTWAVANGNAINGYQGGTTLPVNSTIHVIACSGPSGVGLFAYKNGVTPVLPAGYTSLARRVYSFITGVSGEVLAKFHRDLGGGQLLTLYPKAKTDVSVASHTDAVLYALSVPLGLWVQPIFRATVTGHAVLITSPVFEDDVACPAAAAAGTAPGYSGCTPYANNPVFGADYQLTDADGRIRARCGYTGFMLYIHTRGFVDHRGI